jgi:hypothetical protein
MTDVKVSVGDHREDGKAVAEPTARWQWIYRNLTPWRIHACFTADGTLLPTGLADEGPAAHDGRVVRVLSIPALGEVTLPDEDARLLNTLPMRRLGQIEVRPAPSELWGSLPQAVMIFGWLVVGLFFGAWALFFGGASALPWAWVVTAVVAVPVAALLVATVREVVLHRRFTRYRKAQDSSMNGCGADGRQSLEGVERGSRIRTFVDGVPRHAAEVTVLIGAVVVSVIGLGVAIHLTSQLKELLPVDYGALVRLENPFADVTDLALRSPAFWQLLVGHAAQWVLVSIAALAPAAMYFQFDRQRLESVQRRWVHEVFRLDPTVRTVPDIEAKYGSQIESSFGHLGPDSTLRLGGGRRSPVIVATILLVVGWFLIISTTQVPGLVEAETTAAGVNGTELVWPSSEFPVSAFFRPNLSLVGYAFLGAYVFTLFHVLRGYQRRDLHPRTYNTVVVRILAAYALGLVVSVVYDGPAAEVLMFFVGFMPQSALVWLREQLAQDKRGWRILPLHEPAPLTDLEGIDLYDRTRLAEEGVNNVEALAHADIVDLMSSTRIRAAQLVDWTDQAILYLRVGGDAHPKERHETGVIQRIAGSATPSNPEPMPAVLRNLSHLRSFGIRTATDLLQAYNQALRRGRDDDSKASEVAALRDALEVRSPRHPKVRSIQTIIDTLPDEEWFVQVRNWRCTEFGAADAWYRYLDGHDWTTRYSPPPKHVTNALRPFNSVPMANPPEDPSAPVTDGDEPSRPRTPPLSETEHAVDHYHPVGADGIPDRVSDNDQPSRDGLVA